MPKKTKPVGPVRVQKGERVVIVPTIRCSEEFRLRLARRGRTEGIVLRALEPGAEGTCTILLPEDADDLEMPGFTFRVQEAGKLLGRLVAHLDPIHFVPIR